MSRERMPDDRPDLTDRPEPLDLRSHDITEEKRQELLRLFPEVRTEGGKIDFDRLRSLLGETVDTGKERYGMTWPGKAECFKAIQAPSLATLRPCPEESIDFDTTENLVIEGDNLEVLKLLQKAYLGKVKMIYIDPPYNTGNDFIYPDDYSESLQTYLEYTGQVDAEGRRFGTNTEADGRFHSKWLSMLYPRLYLARDILRDDGVIFVSCDDNEVHHLRTLMNEVFGEENFIAQFVWKARQFSDARATTNVSTDHEYVVAYAKDSAFSLRGNERDESKFSNPDNDPRGAWMSRSILGLATREQRPNLHYDIIEPTTGRVFPPNPATGWRYSPEKMAELVNDKRILFPKKDDGRPREKKFRREMQSDYIAFRSIIDHIHTADGTQEVRALFGAEVFPFPKPSALIEALIQQAVDEDGLVLDFFAGSGATAHAVMDLNALHSGNRKFILVQLPEPTGRDDYPTVADITKERVRRVIKDVHEKQAGRLNLDGAQKQDCGFRVFKLAESNFKPWNAEVPHEVEPLERQLEMHVDHVREGRSDADLLYEILLKSGFPLTASVETLTLAGKTVHSVDGGVLFICLDRELTLDLIRAIAERMPERVVVLDEGFAGNDQLKANAVQIFRTKGITTFKTV
jgi:adenine-specific DNA-methyltransferase